MINSVRLLFCKERGFCKVIYNLIGVFPRNISYYKLAFVHRSASITTKDGIVANNERLEFLGDAILDAIIGDFLFSEYPEKDEGYLTKMRSKFVSRDFLDEIASKMNLHAHIVSNTNNSPGMKHIYGNTLEALIGAIFLDFGYEKTRKIFISKILEKYADLSLIMIKETNFKSVLIEWTQKYKKDFYFVTEEAPFSIQHMQTFVSKLFIEEVEFGKGEGNSKKEAEQNAAKEALLKIGT